MGLLVKKELKNGMQGEFYLRVNNVEASNHNTKNFALVRYYASKEAFDSGKNFIEEDGIEFECACSDNLWEKAYLKLRETYPDAVDA
jgi:hypothetical protein